jgi:hypothetical protein
MKTVITTTRIPTNQANGSYNILLPQGFGQPRGFVVYAMPRSVQPNNFDSTTTFHCLSVGFGGSNIAGTGLTNACAWISNEDGADPTSSRASFGSTVSVFSRNIANSVWRQWQMTNFGQDIIFGTYASSGTQAEPMDLVFTVIGGDDFFCAVGQTELPAAINTPTNVGLSFHPEAILFSHARRDQLTDAQISYGAAIRNNTTFGALGFTFVAATNSQQWRNQDNQGSSIVQNRYSNTGSFNFATNSAVRFQYMYNSGFAVTQSSANASNFIIFLAMKAGYGDTMRPNFAMSNTQFAAASVGRTQVLSDNSGICQMIGTYQRGGNNSTATTTANGADSVCFWTATGRNKSNTVGIGTFTSSTSSTTVTGVGTSFLQQLGVIDNIYNQNYQLVGIVSSITSNTSLLLQSNAAITATGSSFIFEKPKQFGMTYGNRADDGNGNASMRTYLSSDALILFTAQTPEITVQGNFTDVNDFNNPRSNRGCAIPTVFTGVLTATGWLLSFIDPNLNKRRGSIS